MAMGCHHDGHGFLFGTILARAGETETCVERNFSKSFSPHMFPEETCAERNFSKSFSPRNPANWRPGPPHAAIFGSFCAGFGCQRAREGAPGTTCAERSFLKSFSPRGFPMETCAERHFSKNFSPGGFRLRQAVPKRNPMGCHHDGHGLPS